MANNFRITTEYVFELWNATTNSFYQVWVSGLDGSASLAIADVADTTSEEIDWNYSGLQLPVPPLGFEKNYRCKNGTEIQLFNVDTNKWHTLFIGGEQGNPNLSIEKIGEE